MTPKRYVLGTLALTFVGAAVVAGVIGLSTWMGRDRLPSQILVERQFEKAMSTSADIVFVGDSSLGNAIDAQLWGELSGRSAVNLALTGYYGYAGSFHMLKRVLNHRRPQLVVVMHTVDMAARTPSQEAELLMREPNDLLATQRLATTWHIYFNVDQLVQSLRYLWGRALGRTLAAPSEFIENDYIRQGGRRSTGPTRQSIDRQQVKEGSVFWLHSIRHLCHAAAIDCVYIHGPLWSDVCDISLRFLVRTDSAIDQTGIRRIGGAPICMPLDHVGDSPDHVHPNFKQHYTKQYHALLSSAYSK